MQAEPVGMAHAPHWRSKAREGAGGQRKVALEHEASVIASAATRSWRAAVRVCLESRRLRLAMTKRDDDRNP